MHPVQMEPLPNGSRLSCGRKARRRKAVGRQKKGWAASQRKSSLLGSARQLQAHVRPPRHEREQGWALRIAPLLVALLSNVSCRVNSGGGGWEFSIVRIGRICEVHCRRNHAYVPHTIGIDGRGDKQVISLVAGASAKQEGVGSVAGIEWFVSAIGGGAYGAI